jgi:preprotein translocase subunit SecA
MLGLINKLFGNKSGRDIKEIQPLVEEINAEYAKLASISNDELRAKTQVFRNRIAEFLKSIDDEITALNGKMEADGVSLNDKEMIYAAIEKLTKKRDEHLEVALQDLLPEAFAVVKETAKRFKENPEIKVTATDYDKELASEKDFVEVNGEEATYFNSWMAAGTEVTWDMLHYDVQLIGGVVLHQGKIAEMATGEGKTLVSTLPAYLNGLGGHVHIVTVNDYLARRDMEWMGPIHQFLGLTVGCIDNHQPHSDERKVAYAADITYGTNNEFGFDYLRDNMVRNTDELVQGKLHYAMVDEVDSVLVDDARTPLIISGPVPKGDDQMYEGLKPRIERIYNEQKKLHNSFLTEAKAKLKDGNDEEGGLALLRAHRSLPKAKALIKFLSEPGIRQILQKTENKYLQEQAKRMPEVDAELLFVIEEKNNSVDLAEKGVEMMTGQAEDPNFFIMDDLGAAITDIDKSDVSDEDKVKAKDAFFKDFAIKTERVHSVHQLLKAYALFEKDVEYVVMESKVMIVDENTGRIMDGRRYSDGLHQAIEAKEGVFVEAASQTFATVTLQNYFRMYHKLSGMTGTAETEAGEFWEIYELDVIVIPTNRPIVRHDKNDLVYKTIREKFTAIINEVVRLQEAGRPILVGTTNVEISELVSKMLKMRKIKHQVLNAKQHAKEADVVAEAGKSGTVTIATNMAGRGTDIKLSDEVKAAGGLAIIGTERHDSRRVDRQLRGRSGRQGDPGSTQFYVSLEDNLMRLFGSDRIAKLMDRLGYKEGEVLEHKMISKSIERAQKKVEENNFGVRKRLLEYDDVMNKQREVIYKKRKHALSGEMLSVDLNNAFYDLGAELVHSYQMASDYTGFKLEALKWFGIDVQTEEESFLKANLNDLSDRFYHTVLVKYNEKSVSIAQQAFPVIKDVYETRGSQIVNIVIPFTDGQKIIQIVSNLKNAYQSQGKSIIKDFEKAVSLSLVDESWKDHLRQMDELKQSANNATYEQKDPLLIYKKEAFNLFRDMLSKLNRESASFIFKGEILKQNSNEVEDAETIEHEDEPELVTSRNEGDNIVAGDVATKQAPVKAAPKVGRNEDCPCGSGKKYKHCCHGK